MVSHRRVTCGCPQLRASDHSAPAVFPAGKSTAIFHYPTRQCICLFHPPRRDPSLPAIHSPFRTLEKSVALLPVLRHGRGPLHHDNVFIIHRIIRRVGGNQVGWYYAPIGRVESVIYRYVGQKPCRSNIPVSGVGSTHNG